MRPPNWIAAQDLFSIATLGFRGEALASIGSISRMSITSRTADEAYWRHASTWKGGSSANSEKIGAPVGTAVSVGDLFFNVPARLKFLKQDVTERRVIDSLVTRYALAYPQVRIKLSEGGTASLQTSGDGDRRAILAALYGVDTARQMLEVVAEEEGYKVSGFISPTSLTRSNRKEITFFVNGRWVQDGSLSAALLQSYHTLLMVGRYPLAVLFLEVLLETWTLMSIRQRRKCGLDTRIKRSVLCSVLYGVPFLPLHLYHSSHRKTYGEGYNPGI